MKAKKSVCIVSLSAVQVDARVRRQVKYACGHFDVTVIGYGDKPTFAEGDYEFEWVRLPQLVPDEAAAGPLGRRCRLAAGGLWESGDSGRVPVELLVQVANRMGRRVRSPGFQQWLFDNQYSQRALRKCLATIRTDLIHANEWKSLKACAQYAGRTGARLLADFHEYSHHQFGTDPTWMSTISPIVAGMIREYAGQIDKAFVVSADIATAFRNDFGLECDVLYNSPESQPRAEKSIPEVDGKIRFVHHGVAARRRHLEVLIDVMAACRDDCSLTFFLVGQPGYVAELKAYADAKAPGKVHFCDPVAVDEIVETIGQFDMSLFRFDPKALNEEYCMPNKLFDSIQANLGICTAPHKSMADFVRRHEIGIVASDYGAGAIAAAIDAMDFEDVVGYRKKSAELAPQVTADVEMRKLTAAYSELLGP